MYVFGGSTGTEINTGGIYNLAANSWSAMSNTNAPTVRQMRIGSGWSGSKFIVFGGYNGSDLNSGGVLDPGYTDTTGPTILSVTTLGNGTYYPSQVISIVVNFDEAVTTCGTPQITLNTSPTRIATYDSGSGTSSLIFKYTIQTGDTAADLNYAATTSLDLNGGCIRDMSANNATTTLPATGGVDSLGSINDVVITASSWFATSSTNAPDARNEHSAIWTGSRMIIFGGYDSGSNTINTGASFDLVSNSWSQTNSNVQGRTRHTAVWTGSKMIVWSGITPCCYQNSGTIYDVAANSWTQISTVGAPVYREGHTALWTGTEMIVYGAGNSGGRYNPVTDAWSTTTTTNAPDDVSGQVVVWTGSKMLVWGGAYGCCAATLTLGMYDPSTNAWSLYNSTNAPNPSTELAGVWTGSKLIVWGGRSSGTRYNTGGIFDLATNSWSAMTTTNAPDRRSMHKAVWTGTKLIVWGGYFGATTFNTGGVFDPATNSWVAIGPGMAPPGRYQHTMVWTGNRMIIWGGHDGNVTRYNSGGVYDPGDQQTADTWIATSSTGAPSPRHEHVAIWSGSKMIIWGG
jgi:hypothetical protein